MTGPAGAGRSRLLDAAAWHAGVRGARVLRADGGIGDEPFALAHALLGPPAGDPGDPGDPDGGDRSHELTARAVRLSGVGPVVLVADDLERADPESVRWLAQLSRRAGGLRLLVVGSVRTAGPATAGATAGELLAEPGVTVLDASPLTSDDVRAWLAAVPGLPADPDLADACVEVTGGNPRLLDGVLRCLEDAEGEPLEAAVARAREAGAALAGDATVALLADGPPDVLELARAVAVLGPDATADGLAPVAGLDDAAVAGVAARLADLGVLDTTTWRLRPDSAAAAVLADMGEGPRRAAHARAGRVLDSQAAPVARVAAQYLQAGPPADGGVVELLHAASSRVEQQGEPELAVSLLRHALTGPMPDRRRAMLLVDLGIAERTVSPATAQGRLTEALSLLGSARERAGVLVQTVPMMSGVDAAGLVRLLDDGLTDLVAETGGDGGTEAPEDRVLRQALQALLLYASSEDVGQVGRVWDWVDRTDPDVLGPGPGADALRSAHLFFSALGLRTDADGVAGRARAVLAGEIEDSELFQPIRMGALGLLSWTESDTELNGIVERALAAAGDLQRPDVDAFLRGLRSLIHLRCGRVPEALEDARASLAVLTGEVSGEARLTVLPSAALALVELGETDEATELLWSEATVGTSERSWRWTSVFDARAAVLAATGRTREALDASQESGRRLLALGIVNPAALDWRGRSALLLHELGESERAIALAQENVDLARRWGTHGHVGVALRELGVVQGGETGLMTLRAAADELMASPRVLDLARTAVDAGVMARTVGADADSRDLLRRGLDLAGDCGARVLAGRARAELVASGGRPRRSGATTLTPTELDVARLAAAGESNRSIAGSLGVTQRAVEGHLTRAYRKLGIPGRAELAAALDAPGR